MNIVFEFGVFIVGSALPFSIFMDRAVIKDGTFPFMVLLLASVGLLFCVPFSGGGDDYHCLLLLWSAHPLR